MPQLTQSRQPLNSDRTRQVTLRRELRRGVVPLDRSIHRRREFATCRQIAKGPPRAYAYGVGFACQQKPTNLVSEFLMDKLKSTLHRPRTRATTAFGALFPARSLTFR